MPRNGVRICWVAGCTNHVKVGHPRPLEAQMCDEHRGPYLENPPESFVIDQDGYAWAVWPEGHPRHGYMSMVRSTEANTETTVQRTYRADS